MKNPSIKTALIAASALLLPVSAVSAQDATRATTVDSENSTPATSSEIKYPSVLSSSDTLKPPFILPSEAKGKVSLAFAAQGLDLTNPNVEKEMRGILKECRRAFSIYNPFSIIKQRKPYSSPCLDSKLSAKPAEQAPL